jgi:NAD+ kinase
VVKSIAEGKYTTEEYWKLEVKAKGNTIIGMNDITVHNADPRHAIRYELFINDKNIGHKIIGDGVVVATPFGSTGYYRSITDSYFELGIGIAFNNSTEQSDHVVVKEDSVVRIVVARGPAIVYVDNREERISLEEGDEVLIRKSDKVAKILRVV